MPNISGSFAGPIGGASIINQAMQSRGAQGSPLSQLSPSAPTFDPGVAAQGPVPMGAGGQPMMAPPPQQPIPQGMPPQPTPLFQDPQEKIIVEALAKQLERLHKVKEMSVGGGAGMRY